MNDTEFEHIDPNLSDLTHEQHCLIIFYEWYRLPVDQIAARVEKPVAAIMKLLKSSLHLDTKRHFLQIFADREIITNADGQNIDFSNFLALYDNDNEAIQMFSRGIDFIKCAVLETLSKAKKDGVLLSIREVSRELNIDPTIKSDTAYYGWVQQILDDFASNEYVCANLEEQDKWEITGQGESQLLEYYETLEVDIPIVSVD